MRVLLQLVTRASVSIDGEEVARIGKGLVCLVGVAQGDTESDARFLAGKVVNLRIFSDEAGKFNLSLVDVNGELLAVSQFTLLADARKGRRPSFTQAALPVEAEALFNKFVELARATGLRIETGRFQKHMLVEIYNDGPVTILLDSKL
ncbi:MAG: D-aminoacyl-tRNA deacylase [Chloroflexi bacterium]|nr:D-aminoacyl-tRNA deacylase [Chloroflexota bacterium]